LTIKQNESLNGRVLVIFIAIAMSMLRIGEWVASQVVLFQVYGRERVSREHLQIVKIKPRLVVSNGDVLWSRGFEHFLIVGTIWMTLTVLLFSLAWKLLPKPYHDAMQQGTYAGWSILTLIFLFFALGLLPLKLTLILAAVLLVVVLSTARAPLPIDGQPWPGLVRSHSAIRSAQPLLLSRDKSPYSPGYFGNSLLTARLPPLMAK